MLYSVPFDDKYVFKIKCNHIDAQTEFLQKYQVN